METSVQNQAEQTKEQVACAESESAAGVKFISDISMYLSKFSISAIGSIGEPPSYFWKPLPMADKGSESPSSGTLWAIQAVNVLLFGPGNALYVSGQG